MCQDFKQKRSATMEADTISKNGRSSKSQMSRINIVFNM